MLQKHTLTDDKNMEWPGAKTGHRFQIFYSRFRRDKKTEGCEIYSLFVAFRPTPDFSCVVENHVRLVSFF